MDFDWKMFFRKVFVVSCSLFLGLVVADLVIAAFYAIYYIQSGRGYPLIVSLLIMVVAFIFAIIGGVFGYNRASVYLRRRYLP